LFLKKLTVTAIALEVSNSSGDVPA